MRERDNAAWRLVSWPSDLSGLVDVRTPDDALAFVRLFSSVETWYRFPQYGHLELKPVQKLGLNLIGPAQMLGQEFNKLKLPETVAITTSEGFRILRPVARMTCGELGQGRRNDIWGFSVLDETVTQDGRYVLRVLLSEHSSSVGKSIQTLPPVE